MIWDAGWTTAQVIKEMMDQSGAVIKVSQKGDYVPGTLPRPVVDAVWPLSGLYWKEAEREAGREDDSAGAGTTNRIISITGTQNAAAYAHQLVSAKIPQI